MSIFKENKYGGIDVLNEKNELVVSLGSRDIIELQGVLARVHNRAQFDGFLPEYISDYSESEKFSLEDINSHLFSDDEISLDELVAKAEALLSDKKVYDAVLDDYSDLLAFAVASERSAVVAALENNVSVADLVGMVLAEKHPKELTVGQWRVRVLELGDGYGLDNKVTWDRREPGVEFYDMYVNKDSFPDGQFTGGRYYLSTLLGREDSRGNSLDDMVKQRIGLCLDGLVPEWTVQPGDLAVISAWLKGVENGLQISNEKWLFHGDVDVPYDAMERAGLKYDESAVQGAQELVLARLRSVPEFSDVSVEFMGTYNNGFGYSVSFVANTDCDAAKALVNHVLSGLNCKYDFEMVSDVDKEPVSDKGVAPDESYVEKITEYGQKILSDFIEKCKNDGVDFDKVSEEGTEWLVGSIENVEHLAAWYMYAYDGWGAWAAFKEQLENNNGFEDAIVCSLRGGEDITFNMLGTELEKCVVFVKDKDEVSIDSVIKRAQDESRVVNSNQVGKEPDMDVYKE